MKPTARKLYRQLNDMPIPETKFFINVEFNDALVRMRDKVDRVKELGVDTTENEEIMERLSICWGIVNSVYRLNESYYSKLTILGAALATLNEEVAALRTENEKLKEELNERFATGEVVVGKD